MAELKAGAVAVEIIGDDKDIKQKIAATVDRFKKFGAVIRDVFVTTAPVLCDILENWSPKDVKSVKMPDI